MRGRLPVAVAAVAVVAALGGCASAPEEPAPLPDARGPSLRVEELSFDGATHGHYCVWVDVCHGVHLSPPDSAFLHDLPANVTRASFDVTWTEVDASTRELQLFLWQGPELTQQVRGPSPLHVELQDLSAGGIEVYLDGVRPLGAPANANSVQPWHLQGEYAYLA